MYRDRIRSEIVERHPDVAVIRVADVRALSVEDHRNVWCHSVNAHDGSVQSGEPLAAVRFVERNVRFVGAHEIIGCFHDRPVERDDRISDTDVAFVSAPVR